MKWIGEISFVKRTTLLMDEINAKKANIIKRLNEANIDPKAYKFMTWRQKSELKLLSDGDRKKLEDEYKFLSAQYLSLSKAIYDYFHKETDNGKL